MKIEKNKVVSISYELEVEGKIADKAEADKPLEYIHGTGMLLPKFEAELDGKAEGDSFEFTLTPEEGYGVYDETYVIEVPKTAFMMEGKVREDLLVPGYIIPMYNSDGQVVQGLVSEVLEEAVKMDFNHPMAGKTLHFTGKVVALREATGKELAEGLHGEYLPKEGCHGCHHGDGEGCCHGEGEGCCHGEGHHGDGEGCCHGEGHHGDGEGCCHGEGHHGEGCCHEK